MQQPDRTTKSLLFLITVALWGILIKGLFTPAPGVAALQQAVLPVQIVGVRSNLPVEIIRQSQPVEIRLAPGQGSLNVGK